ncbi:MAG: TonB-dependent receptor [Campylobacterales bacterium]|nr:TonB-dependent receptor [Campylobacterales bacterium]
MKQSVTIPCALLCATLLFGLEEQLLESVIVTTSQTDSTIQELSANTTLLDADQIELLPFGNLKETLVGLEGSTVIEHRGLSDVNPSILLRGIPNQARTLILLDGVVMNTSYNGSAPSVFNLPVESLEQIEVVRGPYSSLYGSSAMGGVVHFVTKMPDKPEYRASIGYGDALHNDEANGRVIQSYLRAADSLGESWRFALDASVMDTQGYRSDWVSVSKIPPSGYNGFVAQSSSPLPGTPQWIVGDAGRGGVDKYHLSAKLRFEQDDDARWDLTVREGHHHLEYDDPRSLLTLEESGETAYSFNAAGARLSESKFLQGQSDLLSRLYQLAYCDALLEGTLSASLSHLSTDDWYTTADSKATRDGGLGTLTPRENRSSALHVNYLHRAKSGRYLIGAEYKQNSADAETYGLKDWRDESSKTERTGASGGKEEIIALYTDVRHDFGADWWASLGMRYETWKTFDGYTRDDMQADNSLLNADYDAKTHNNFAPKISLGYNLTPETQIKSSIGSAFRAPDAVNLYRTYEIPLMKRVYVANPELKPERSLSYEIGIEQRLIRYGMLKAYLFHTQLEEMLSTKTLETVDGTTYYGRINVGKARSQGYEVAWTQPLPFHLLWSANMTRTFTEVLENDADPASVNKQFEGIARERYSLSAIYDDAFFYTALYYMYHSKIYNRPDNADTATDVYGSLDPSGIVNLKLGYRIDDTINLSLSINNLFDHEYYSYERAEGTAWFAQLHVRL